MNKTTFGILNRKTIKIDTGAKQHKSFVNMVSDIIQRKENSNEPNGIFDPISGS